MPGEKGEAGAIGPPGRDGEKGARGKRGKRVSFHFVSSFGSLKNLRLKKKKKHLARIVLHVPPVHA